MSDPRIFERLLSLLNRGPSGPIAASEEQIHLGRPKSEWEGIREGTIHSYLNMLRVVDWIHLAQKQYLSLAKNLKNFHFIHKARNESNREPVMNFT